MKELQMHLMSESNMHELEQVELTQEQCAYAGIPTAERINPTRRVNELSVVVGFTVEDAFIGYAVIGWNYEYMITRFAIDRSHRNRGYGTAAMGKMLAYIKTQPLGLSNRVCLTVHPENERAIRFCKKIGFVVTDDFWSDEDYVELSHYFELPKEVIRSKIELREPVAEDAQNLLWWYNNRHIHAWRFADNPQHEREISEGHFIHKIEAGSYADFPNIMYSVYAANVHIGFATLQKRFAFFSDEADTVAIGLAIPSAAFRDRGYGFVACSKLIEQLREDDVHAERYTHIYIETLSYNHRALRLAQKLGFYEIERKRVEAAVEEGIELHRKQIESVVGAISAPYEAVKCRLDF